MNHEVNIDAFFDALEPFSEALIPTLSYMAIKASDGFIVIQARLFFDVGPNPVAPRMFESKSLQAAIFPLAQMGCTPRELIAQVLAGRLSANGTELLFPPAGQGGYGSSYIPFLAAALEERRRIVIFNIRGAEQSPYIKQPDFDWELKAASTPYDSVDELASDYRLTPLRGDPIIFEAVFANALRVDRRSTIDGNIAKPVVQLAYGLSPDKVTLGLRIFRLGGVVDRRLIQGRSMQWSTVDGVQYGATDIAIPDLAVIQSYASYGGIAQHHWWIDDPTRSLNPRRAAYASQDPGLKVLLEFLTRSPSKSQPNDARDLESAVSWLLWILGFSAAHLGGTKRTQDAADLIVTTPGGHFAVLECTTGLLKAENKLSTLVSRSSEIRTELERANNKHLRVLPVIVTTRTRDEVAADIEQAERLGVMVVTRETLDHLVSRTVVMPNPEQIYEEAVASVAAGQQKYGLT